MSVTSGEPPAWLPEHLLQIRKRWDHAVGNRQHLPVPIFPLAAQLVEQIGAFAGHVAALSRVVADVEQVLLVPHLQIFPLASADGPLVAIGHPPVECALADWRLS